GNRPYPAFSHPYVRRARGISLDRSDRSGGGGRTGDAELPQVAHVDEGHEPVGAVVVEPERRRLGAGGGDQLAVVDPRAVDQGDAHVAAFEVAGQLGQRKTFNLPHTRPNSVVGRPIPPWETLGIRPGPIL